MKKIFLIFFIMYPILLATPGLARGQSPDAPPAYTLQLMTILDKFTADKELQKFRSRGYDAYLAEYTTQTGKVIYKLRSGRYGTRAEASEASGRYAEKEGASVMIVTSREAGEKAQTDSAAQAAGAKKDTSGKSVRITVQDADNGSRPDSLQEKVDSLKHGEMPRKQKKSKKADDIWFTIQTSTEPVKRSAEHRINKLRDKGYDAYCVESIQHGRIFYKIRFGKFWSAEEASRAAGNYSNSERRKCMVVKIAGGKESEPPIPPQIPAPDTALQQAAQQPALPEMTALSAAKPQPNALRNAPNLPEDDPKDLETPENDPAAEKQSAAQQADSAAEQEQPALEETEPEAAEADSGENTAEQEETNTPERVSKIYAYREKSGALNLTNRYEDIPEPLRTNIDYISIYPVRIRDLPKNGPRLTLIVEGEKKEIILGGLAFPRQSEPAQTYLEGLKSTVLRLKYNPWMPTKDGAIAGRLYKKEGSYVNLDMVRKGLAQYDGTTLAPDQQEAFRQAQEAAKRDHVGIWK